MLSLGVPKENSVNENRSERRQWTRYPCQWVASWPSVTAEAPTNEVPWTARVQDYSVTGVALLCDHPLPVGKTVLVDISDQEEGVTQPLRLHVMHCAEQPDGRWVVGCSIRDED